MSRARILADLLNNLQISGDITVDQITANTLTGTVSTAAQPNITSLGTLTSLTSSGTISGATYTGNTINIDTTTANSYYEKTIVQNVTGATTIDVSTGTTFVHTLDGSVTYTISNPPTTGLTQGITIKIIQDSNANGYTVAWPGSVKWAAQTAPTLTATASAVDIITLFTHDGGANYYGFVAGQDVK